jgi:hypothetical protein
MLRWKVYFPPDSGNHCPPQEYLSQLVSGRVAAQHPGRDADCRISESSNRRAASNGELAPAHVSLNEPYPVHWYSTLTMFKGLPAQDAGCL